MIEELAEEMGIDLMRLIPTNDNAGEYERYMRQIAYVLGGNTEGL